MRAGPFRHILSIQKPVTGARSTTGQPSVTWTTVSEVFGNVETLSGRELEFARATDPRASHRVTLRSPVAEGLTPKHRILWGSRELNVVAVLDATNRGVETLALCEERIATTFPVT